MSRYPPLRTQEERDAFARGIENPVEIDLTFEGGENDLSGADEPPDYLGLRRIDHVRFFVGNARQSAYFYRNAFDFDVVAYAGLETRVKHEAGYVLKQGDITFVLASPLGPDHPEAYRVVRHGDGVQDIALEVANVRAAYEHVLNWGAEGLKGPTTLKDE